MENLPAGHSEPKNYWQKCNSCKKEIPFHSKYYFCSVSTCQGEKLGFHFCSVSCWDAHLGFARHRDAAALEATSPSRESSDVASQNPDTKSAPPLREGARKIIVSSSTLASPKPSLKEVETLVVVSKVKQLIRTQSEMNTSQCAVDALTQKVVDECLKAIEKARASGRKTVMGRDIE